MARIPNAKPNWTAAMRTWGLAIRVSAHPAASALEGGQIRSRLAHAGLGYAGRWVRAPGDWRRCVCGARDRHDGPREFPALLSDRGACGRCEELWSDGIRRAALPRGRRAATGRPNGVP